MTRFCLTIYLYLRTLYFLMHSWGCAFQVALVLNNPLANAGDIRDVGLIPGQEDLLDECMAIQYSYLENLMDRGSCWATVHRFTKSWT